jgi:O-antigen/teichoic acid export membrane protein
VVRATDEGPPAGAGASGVRRAGWAVGDQALSSITNLVLAVAVARSVDADGFGAFGLAFTIYTLCTGLARAVASEPLVVRHSSSDPATRSPAVRAAAGASLAVGSACGLACIVGGLVAGGTVALALVPLGLLLPGLLLQDTWRFAFLAEGRPRRAAANDLVWAGALVVSMAAAVASGRVGVAWFVVAWGASACIAAGVGIAQSGAWPAAGEWHRWVRSHRDLIPGFVAELIIRNGGWQVTILVLTATGGLAAVGALRGAQVVFGPLNVLLLGIGLAAVPEAVRLRHRSLDRLDRLVVAMSVGLASVAVAAGLASLAIPDSLGVALLGDTWTDTRPVLLPQALLMASIGAVAGFLTGLRALAAASRSVMARVVILPASLAGGVVGSWAGGAVGAVTGLAVANWLGVGVWGAQYRRARRRAGQEGGRPQASATDAGSVTVVPGGISAMAARKST